MQEAMIVKSTVGLFVLPVLLDDLLVHATDFLAAVTPSQS